MKKEATFILLLCTIFSYGQKPIQKNVNDSLYAVWQDDTQLDSMRIQAIIVFIKNELVDEKPDNAYILAKELKDFSKSQGNRFVEAEALHFQARSFDDRGDLKKAVELYQQAILIREEIDDKNGIAGSAFNLGLIYQAKEEIPKAIEYFERSIGLDEEVGNQSGMSSTLSTLSEIYIAKGEFSKAIDYLEQSVQIDKETGNQVGAALGLCKVGICYTQQNDLTNALDYFVQSLEILEEVKHKEGSVQLMGNIGIIHQDKGNFAKALSYYRRALVIYEELGNKVKSSRILTTMGIIFYDQGDYPKALDHYKSSLKISQEIADTLGVAHSTNNIGNVYRAKGDFPKALEYYERSMEIKEEIKIKGTGYDESISAQLSNISQIYKEQGALSKAMDYSERALKMREEEGDKEEIAISLNLIGSILHVQLEYDDALKYYEDAFALRKEVGNQVGITNSLRNIGEVYRNQGKHAKAIDYCNRSLTVAEDLGSLLHQKEACKCLYDTYKTMKNGDQALLFLEKVSILEDSLDAEETALNLQQMEFAKVIEADSIDNAKEKQNVQMAHETEVNTKNKQRNIFLTSGLFALMLAIGFFVRWRYVKKSRDKISVEKERSENILLNILPAEIAEELKIKGSAEARDFDQVSILFTDFKEFTQMSEQLSAKKLVEEINYCFEVFDSICEKYGIEKIKTIGDAYMAAGGLNAPSYDSTVNIVSAALEMAAFIVERKEELNKKGQLGFEMRAGIHTGNVVAGIVGVKKFQYDVWGDTVNTASRIESQGKIRKVNISQSTYDLIKGDPQFSFESRGKIVAKGKGEIEMYFVSKIV